VWADPRPRWARARVGSLSAGLLAAFCAGLCPWQGAGAQSVPVGDVREDYLRLLQILGRAEVGSLSVRPLRDVAGALEAEGPWSDRFGSPPRSDGALVVAPTDIRLRLFHNTSFPVGQNDGAVWQGTGLTSALEAGVTASWRGLSVALRPTLIHTGNASFELGTVTVPGQPVYAYPWRMIDLPQRFGPDPFWTLDPGQSEVRVHGFGATAGVSTANLWWGPARRNGIIMSNNGPGFEHAFVGTDGPLDVGVGEIELQWVWGDLDQTDWLDPTLATTDRFLTGIVAAFSPSFLPGLSLGLTRVFYAWKPDGGVPFGDYFIVFQGVRKEYFVTPQNPTGNDEHDQMLSLFGRWVIPEGGFEVYWEWARNDHSWNFRDFILEPDHSQGYTLGLQKAIELSGKILTIGGELTHLERSTTRELREVPSYYVHNVVAQGYTQRGQIIGAGVGPGGNAQHFGAELYAEWGRLGLFLQRDVRDNDSFYTWVAANNGTRWDHDISLHAGTDAVFFAGDWDWNVGLMLTRELNRYYYWRDLWNLNMTLSARWRAG